MPDDYREPGYGGGWNQTGAPRSVPPTGGDSRQDEFLHRYQSIFQEQQVQPMRQQPPQSYPSPPPRPLRKEKKRKSGRGGIALLVVVCMILSGVSGFAGGYAASLYFEGNQEAPVSTAGYIPPPTNLSAHESQETPSITDIAKIAAPSVVEISTEVVTTNPYWGDFVSSGAGSGVIISPDGYIVTNHHVIANAKSITVRLSDGEAYPADLIGSDSQADIAVLKIEAAGLPAATLGDSDSLQVGDFALAIGNPLGELGGTVTDGIISALGRPVTVEGRTMTLLQTNAAINSGNSGGGLFNSEGQLVGIVNAKSMGSGIEGLGFAIPINAAKPVINDLMGYGYVTGRPALGITPVDIKDARTAMNYHVQYLGVYVAEVDAGSAAEKAGIAVGDYILMAGGQQVSSSEQLSAIISAKSVGDPLEIQVMRAGTAHTMTVILQERTSAG